MQTPTTATPAGSSQRQTEIEAFRVARDGGDLTGYTGTTLRAVYEGALDAADAAHASIEKGWIAWLQTAAKNIEAELDARPKLTTDLATPTQKFFPAEALYQVVVGGVVIGTRKSSRVYRYAVTAVRGDDVRYVISYHSRYDLAEKATHGYDFSIVNTRVLRFVAHKALATEKKPIVTNHTVYRVTDHDDGRVRIMGRNVRKTAKCYSWTDEKGAPRRADIATAGYFDSVDEALQARLDDVLYHLDRAISYLAGAEANEAYRGQVSWSRDQVRTLRFEVDAVHAAFFYLHATDPADALRADDKRGVPAGLPDHRNPVDLIVA